MPSESIKITEANATLLSHKKAQFPYSFHSFACLRYFYITYVKHSCPLKSKMFSRSVVAVISQACDTSIDKLYLRSSRTAKGHFPTFGHEISGQCIILVFLLKKKKMQGLFLRNLGFIFYFVETLLKCNGILFLFIFGDRKMNGA